MKESRNLQAIYIKVFLFCWGKDCGWSETFDIIKTHR